MGPSIQETLETALSTVLQEAISVEAASRTDAGVHALAQTANFFTSRPMEKLDRLHYSLNQLLPKNITVTELQEASESFHPTLDNRGKEYHYYICHGQYQMPANRCFSWHFPHVLDIENMRKAASYFIGEKDFSSLLTEKLEHRYKDHVRDLRGISIDPLPDQRLVIKVSGRTFLYKMVRTLVGTLAYVGCGKICVDDIPEILNSGERARAGVTAPAHGLYLASVEYD